MGLFKKKPAQPAAHVAAGPPPVHVTHWDAARFKIQLRMAKTRIEVQRTKRENSIVTNRRTAADHLRSGKDELARIFTEKLLRERSQIESFDVMMTYVELLIESCQFIGNVRDFDRAPADVKESVASLVYGAQRMSSVHELQVASQILRTHFGAAIIDPIVRGEDGPHLHCVNSLLAIKLDCTTPDPALVREELIRIANEFNIDWTAPPDTYGSVQPAYAPNMYPPHNPGPNLGGHPPSAPPPPPPGPSDYYGGGGGGMYAGSSVPPVNPNSIPGLYPPSSVPPSVPPSVPSSMPPLAPMMPPMAPPGGAPHGLGPTPPPNAPPHPEHLSSDFLASRFDQLNRGTK